MIDYHLQFKHKLTILVVAILLFLPLIFLYFTYTPEASSAQARQAYAQMPLRQISPSRQIIKTLSLRGTIRDVALSKDGKTAYVAAASRGIYILDLEDPLKPKILSQFKYFKNAYDKARSLTIAEDERTLFVRDAQAGIYRIDITNVLEPKLLSAYLPSSPISGFTVSGDSSRLYITGSKGLEIADIHNPDEIKPISRFNQNTHYLDAAEVKPGRLYLLCAYGIDVVDVSLDNAPELMTKYTTLGEPQTIALSAKKDKAYIASGRSGVEILSLSNTITPKPLGSYESLGSASAIHLSSSEETIFVANENEDLEIVDVSQPDNASRLQNIHRTASKKGEIWNSALSPDEKVLYLAHGVLGLGVVRLQQE